MQTVAQPQPRCNPTTAMYATLDGESGILAKVDGVIAFYRYDGTRTPYEPALAPYVTLLGSCGLSEAQYILDHMQGGAARLCTQRRQET